jgi:transposase
MAQPTYQQLLAENRQLRADNAELARRLAQADTRIGRLETQLRDLSAQLQEALRASKRQAAPFAKGPPKDKPKRPGRKAGAAYGPKAHRPVPEGKPDEVFDVPCPETCPDCGGPINEDHTAQQFQAEVPRKPLLRRFDLHIGRCAGCGKRVQPRHRLQTSDALGAAASQLGPDAHAAIAYLNKHAGLPHGKIAAFFKAFFGIRLSRAGACQSTLRSADRCRGLYDGILSGLGTFPWIVPDETGWRVGGRSAWLHAAVTEQTTAYLIDPHRGYAAAEQLIGADYAGGLIHDGFAPYDRFWQAWHQQCLNHLLTRSKRLLAAATAGAVRFPRQVRQLLRDALRLRDRRDAGQVSEHGLACSLGRLKARLGRLLRWTRTHAANERFAAHLNRHRDDLFTFLETPGIDATNHRAERALRPAVLARKVSGGSRTPRGAWAHACLMSTLASALQQGLDFCRLLAARLCGRPVHLAYQPAGP